MKIRVFIGSTKEGLKFVNALAELLGTQFHYSTWHQTVFEISGNTQLSLVKGISESDFAIFILTADDNTRSRNKEYFTPRDNLIFEAGISFGSLEPHRTFLIPEGKSDFKLPSDLAGFTLTRPFDANEDPKQAMLLQATQIGQRIEALGKKPVQHYSGKQDVLVSAANSLLRTAEHSIVLFGRDLSWAPKYAQVIKERTKKGVSVEVFSDLASQEKAKKNAQILIDAGAKVHYCQRDTGIKLSLIDHEKNLESQFMIVVKERNPAFIAGGNPGDQFLYRYSINDARHTNALWLTLVRLYDSFKAETARKPRATPKARPKRK